MIRRQLSTARLGLSLGLALLAAPARADCPIPSLDVDQVEQAIRATPSCRAAFALLDVCRRGAGSDVALADIVINKCETSFVDRLSAARRRAYDQDRAGCTRRSDGEGGTLGASLRATCLAGVASRFAR